MYNAHQKEVFSWANSWTAHIIFCGIAHIGQLCIVPTVKSEHYCQAYHKVLGLQGDLVPDWVISIILPLLDFLKQHSIVLIICTYTQVFCSI